MLTDKVEKHKKEKVRMSDAGINLGENQRRITRVCGKSHLDASKEYTGEQVVINKHT